MLVNVFHRHNLAIAMFLIYRGNLQGLPKISTSVITMSPYWARWRHKSQASRLFTQWFVEAQSKKTSKPRTTVFYTEKSPVTDEFPAQRASNAVTHKMFPFDDVIMVEKRITWQEHVLGFDNHTIPRSLLFRERKQY